MRAGLPPCMNAEHNTDCACMGVAAWKKQLKHSTLPRPPRGWSPQNMHRQRSLRLCGLRTIAACCGQCRHRPLARARAWRTQSPSESTVTQRSVEDCFRLAPLFPRSALQIRLRSSYRDLKKRATLKSCIRSLCIAHGFPCIVYQSKRHHPLGLQGSHHFRLAREFFVVANLADQQLSPRSLQFRPRHSCTALACDGCAGVLTVNSPQHLRELHVILKHGAACDSWCRTQNHRGCCCCLTDAVQLHSKVDG